MEKLKRADTDGAGTDIRWDTAVKQRNQRPRVQGPCRLCSYAPGLVKSPEGGYLDSCGGSRSELLGPVVELITGDE